MVRSLTDRLREYHQKREQSTSRPSSITIETMPYKQMNGFSVVENEMGVYYHLKKRWNGEEKRGTYLFREIFSQDLRLLTMMSPSSSETIEITPQNLLFFDTETTGLGSGAGTSIFLFGLGYYEDQDWVVEQFFLPDPSGEKALLIDLINKLSAFDVLVTYNGRSFDWNLLETRLMLHHLSMLKSLIHADLLYPARRLWKHHLLSCRLQEIEKRCLQIIRQDDTPGYLAPQLYFEYLRSRQFGSLSGVIQHNQDDVSTLSSLLIHLLHLLQGSNYSQVYEQIAVGKWMLEYNRDEGAKRLQALLHSAESRVTDRKQVLQVLSAIYKQRKEWSVAVDLWKQWLKISGFDVTPYIELAKYYEHQEKNMELALSYTEQAVDLLLQKKMLYRSSLIQSQLDELHHRANRLISKRDRQQIKRSETG